MDYNRLISHGYGIHNMMQWNSGYLYVISHQTSVMSKHLTTHHLSPGRRSSEVYRGQLCKNAKCNALKSLKNILVETFKYITMSLAF